MQRGKFFATDDFDLAGHRLLNWRWLEDLPTSGAVDGQAIVLVDGVPTWTTITTTGGGGGPVAWDDITGVPTVFPPDAHTHPLSQLTQSGATTGQVATWNATSGAWEPASPGAAPSGAVDSIIAGTGIAVSTSVGDVTVTCNLTWSELANKPATFTPASHTHLLSDLQQTSATTGQVIQWTGNTWLPGTVTGGTGTVGVADLTAGTGINLSTSIGSVTITCDLTWTELGNKPATFTPASHTHLLGDLRQTSATTGQVVTWDGTQWEAATLPTPATGIVGDSPMLVLPGSYATNGRGGGSDGNVALAISRQIISPYIPTHTYSASSIGFRVASGAGAGTTARVVVFDADSDGQPTTVLYTSAALATSAAAIVLDNATTFTFSSNKVYWVGIWSSAAVVYSALAIGDAYVLGYSGASTAPTRALVRAQTYAATGTVNTWSYTNTDMSIVAPPRVLFLVTSVA